MNREDLVGKRREIVKNIHYEIERYIQEIQKVREDFKNDNPPSRGEFQSMSKAFFLPKLETIFKRYNPDQEFSVLGWYMIHHYEQFSIQNRAYKSDDDKKITNSIDDGTHGDDGGGDDRGDHD